MIEDIRKASDEQLSVPAAFEEAFHTSFVFGAPASEDPYHFGVIQTTLTRSVGAKAPEVHEEIVAAFNDEIPMTTDWVKVPTLDKVLRIVVRASNRLFVGLPLCRNEEWKELNINLTRLFFQMSETMNLFPKLLQPIVGWYISPRTAAFRIAAKLIRPMILERLERLKNNTDDRDEYDDLLAWLIKAAGGKKERLDPNDLTSRMLNINVAAIHTTAFTHALFHLASRPDLIEPLREEAERMIQEEGWTRNGMRKMSMMDSFLKESQRVSSSDPINVVRMAVTDFTFSNGTTVPAGTFLTTCQRAIHFDEVGVSKLTRKFYPNANEFDPLRSYRRRGDENESLKHQMITPDLDYLSFGIGKHACPGRFFAVNELKLLFAHTLLHYDIKYDDGDAKHKPNMFGGRTILDGKTQIMFRKRATA
ncbi:hypothetical protein VNI00_002295 [Paramarasmius palmivorus]|uniref:Cytochrome P450 n=1 Tax=Paramarasmius palmivorus TaxID=297713 RepID=A0AAW0E3U9_9AGAR